MVTLLNYLETLFMIVFYVKRSGGGETGAGRRVSDGVKRGRRARPQAEWWRGIGE